jgi:WD40 repeat protein
MNPPKGMASLIKAILFGSVGPGVHSRYTLSSAAAVVEYYQPTDPRLVTLHPFTGGAGGEIRLWDLRSRTMAAHLKLHHQPISALEVLADDTHVVAACHDRSLSLWDLQEEKCRATFRSPTATVLGLVVAPDQVGHGPPDRHCSQRLAGCP